MAPVAVRDGHLKQLDPVLCPVCQRLLCRMDLDGLKPGKTLELKCKCNAFAYRVGVTT